VDAAVEHAREGADWWGALSFGERAHYLPTWHSVITRRIAQLSELAHLETGKPTGDAQLETVLAIDHIAWAAKARQEGSAATGSSHVCRRPTRPRPSSTSRSASSV
jgi:acyl-CoA reductase-like NAD-dependent aldehyde dehydrogenase